MRRRAQPTQQPVHLTRLLVQPALRLAPGLLTAVKRHHARVLPRGPEPSLAPEENRGRGEISAKPPVTARIKAAGPGGAVRQRTKLGEKASAGP